MLVTKPSRLQPELEIAVLQAWFAFALHDHVSKHLEKDLRSVSTSRSKCEKILGIG